MNRGRSFGNLGLCVIPQENTLGGAVTNYVVALLPLMLRNRAIK